MNEILEFTSHRRSIYVQVRATSLGVLMSVSLALLAYNILQFPNQNDLGADIARGLASFIVIIWVTMEYISYSMIQDRYPSWIDTIQLHMLGAAQIACSVFVGKQTPWFWSSIVMAAIGIWAYSSQYPSEDRDLIFPSLQPIVKKNIWIAFACCVGSLATLLWYDTEFFNQHTIAHVYGVKFTLRDVLLVCPYFAICAVLSRNTARLKRAIMEPKTDVQI